VRPNPSFERKHNGCPHCRLISVVHSRFRALPGARDLGLLLLVGLVSAAIGFLVNFSLPSARVLTLDGIAYPLAATYVLFYVVVVSAACTWVWPPPTGRSAA